MSPVQSNTQEGIVTKLANSDLSGKEGLLAKLVDATGSCVVDLAGVGDLALFVIVEGGASGKPVQLLPLDGSRNVRVISGATIAGGVQVAPDASGKLRAAVTSDYTIGVTEEDGTSGQYTLIRPITLGLHA